VCELDKEVAEGTRAKQHLGQLVLGRHLGPPWCDLGKVNQDYSPFFHNEMDCSKPKTQLGAWVGVLCVCSYLKARPAPTTVAHQARCSFLQL
jgi:hypothetical protein